MLLPVNLTFGAVAIVLICTITAIITYCGWHGSYSERVNLLVIYGIVLTVLMAIEGLTVVIVASVRDEIDVIFENQVDYGFKNYRKSFIFRAIINDIQNMFKW